MSFPFKIHQKHIEAHTCSVSKQMSTSHFGIIYVADCSVVLLLLWWVSKNSILTYNTDRFSVLMLHIYFMLKSPVKTSKCCSAHSQLLFLKLTSPFSGGSLATIFSLMIPQHRQTGRTKFKARQWKHVCREVSKASTQRKF